MSTNKGNIISELRREAGYTQKTLADALHVTDKAVSKWERGICQPDSSLLPKLSLLLDADIELLLHTKVTKDDEWIGLLDLQKWDVDLSEKVYDKPMVYFMLSHFLLLDIRDIYVRTSKKNEEFLSQKLFEDLGFTFTFDFGSLPKCNVMVLNRPLFLFGSDLTRQFQGAMATRSLVKLVPVNQGPTFLFCPTEYAFMYLKNPDYLYETASDKTLGRGMVSVELDSSDNIYDAGGFVRFYQNNSDLLIGSLEEIAFRKGIIDKDKFMELACETHYFDRLKSIAETR